MKPDRGNNPSEWAFAQHLPPPKATALILLPILLTKGVGSAQRIKGASVVLIGIVAAIVYQGVFVIFNR